MRRRVADQPLHNTCINNDNTTQQAAQSQHPGTIASDLCGVSIMLVATAVQTAIACWFAAAVTGLCVQRICLAFTQTHLLHMDALCVCNCFHCHQPTYLLVVLLLLLLLFLVLLSQGLRRKTLYSVSVGTRLCAGPVSLLASLPTRSRQPGHRP